jgi:two-component system LytT family response regulator
MNLSILIIEDDFELTKKLNSFLTSQFYEVATLDHSPSISEAFPKYMETFHELVIINISKDAENSFVFLEKIINFKSHVIIICDDDRYALQCYKYNVLDYLISPVMIGDLSSSIIKCVNFIDKCNSFNNTSSDKIYQKFIPITSTKKIELIKMEEIVHFEADGRYTMVHLSNGISKMASKNLGEFQKLLDPNIFCRIHHKYIINLDKLSNINKSDGFYCEMTNSKMIPVSKRKLDYLNRLLNVGKTF